MNTALAGFFACAMTASMRASKVSSGSSRCVSQGVGFVQPELTKDLRPAYAGRSLVPVGSKSVLKVIEKYEPILGLHGHIHEGKGTRKFKKTLCINPGSMYEQGVLHGAVVELKPNKVGNYVLTTG